MFWKKASDPTRPFPELDRGVGYKLLGLLLGDTVISALERIKLLYLSFEGQDVDPILFHLGSHLSPSSAESHA
jgi:hypothetical protein